MPIVKFSRGQEQAWDFIRKAVGDGLPPTASLRSYREGGGHIRTQDWYRSYHVISEGLVSSRELGRFGVADTIPDSFWTATPRAYQKQYVVQVNFYQRMQQTGKRERVFKTVESDYKLSQAEINIALAEAGHVYIPSESWDVDGIIGYQFFQRGEVE